MRPWHDPGNHEGSIYQRADGYWVCRLRLSPARLVMYAKTRTDAVRKLQALVKAHHQGALVQPSKLTLGAWAEGWPSERDLLPSTRGTYRQVLMPVLKDVGQP